MDMVFAYIATMELNVFQKNISFWAKADGSEETDHFVHFLFVLLVAH
jgi:hypothetical protein